MTFRAFSGWAVRTLLGMCVFGLLFSLFANLDAKATALTLFGELYEHASIGAQDRLGQKMHESWCDEKGPAECKTQDNKALLLAFTAKAVTDEKIPQIPLQKAALPLSVAALLLLVALYFIENDHVLLTWHLGKLFLSLGFSCLAMFALAFAWGELFPPNTTPIIDAVTGGELTAQTLRQSALLIVPFVLKQVFGIVFLYAGLCFCVMGVMLRVIAKRELAQRREALMRPARA